MATDTFAPGHPPAPPTSQPPRKPDSETDEERVYRNVSFASTDYIPWILGRLRLGRADLTRMNSSGVPVLRSHDGDSPVGRVTSVPQGRDGRSLEERLGPAQDQLQHQELRAARLRSTEGSFGRWTSRHRLHRP